MSNSEIYVDRLAKHYRVHQKETGLGGSLWALLWRRHETIRAVDDISFQIEKGEVVGFLGPNGAGKTTTLKVLAGLLYPTAGAVSICGFVPFERRYELLRRITLVMGQKHQLLWDLPALESFEVNRAIYEIPLLEYRATLRELTTLLEIEPVLRKQVRKLSLGERMKCELAAALLHRPSVLFLDEPTIGLDVTMQARMREFLIEYNRSHGATILLTSHYMADVTALCRRVVMIDHGKLVYDGDLDALMERVAPYKQIHIVSRKPLDAVELASFAEIRSLDTWEATLVVPRDRASDVIGRLFRTFTDRGCDDRGSRGGRDRQPDLHRKNPFVTDLSKFTAEFRACWHLAIEYRIVLFIWMLSMVLPLVMMAAWLSIARDGSVGSFGPTEFVAYYVGAIVVRNLTGVWIIWELDADIRKGELSFKLLKPMNPIIHYMAQSLASKPIRGGIMIPILAVTAWMVSDVDFATSPVMILMLVLALAGTWALLFLIQYTIGLLGFWITHSLALNDAWFGFYSLLSGYLIPLELFSSFS